MFLLSMVVFGCTVAQLVDCLAREQELDNAGTNPDVGTVMSPVNCQFKRVFWLLKGAVSSRQYF